MRTGIVATLLLAFASTASIAQTHFSFSGLNWGDSLERVDSQLKASGLPIRSTVDKLSCKVKKSCRLDFAGGVRGSVLLVDDKLVEVWIYAEDGPQAFTERLARLRARYGEPLPSPPSSSAFGMWKTKWQAPNGETLELEMGGSILYKSSPGPSRDQGVKF